MDSTTSADGLFPVYPKVVPALGTVEMSRRHSRFQGYSIVLEGDKGILILWHTIYHGVSC
jgi:hypothetical protein